MMLQDNCVICKKPLFGEKGKRLVAECYGVYLMRKRADSHGTYSDCSKGGIYLCPDCLKKRNGSSILGALIEQKEHSDSIEKIQSKGDWICQ
jgi:hypothetical protein